MVWWHNQEMSEADAYAQGGPPPGAWTGGSDAGVIVGGYDPFTFINTPSDQGGNFGGGVAGGIGDIVLGGLGTLVNWGVSNLPARRPPSLPPARTGGGGPPARLPPAGVPYPTGGGRVGRIGAMGPVVAGAVRIAVLAAGGYEIGKWLYDAAGNLIGHSKKRRRMDVLNPRALRRSMRRVQGFAHFARKTILFTHRVRMKKGRFGSRRKK